MKLFLKGSKCFQFPFYYVGHPTNGFPWWSKYALLGLGYTAYEFIRER